MIFIEQGEFTKSGYEHKKYILLETERLNKKKLIKGVIKVYDKFKKSEKGK